MHGAEAGFDADGRAAGADAAVNRRMLDGAGDCDGEVGRNVAHAGMRVEISVEAIGKAKGDVAEAGGKLPVVGDARA